MLLRDSDKDTQALEFLRQAVLLEKEVKHLDYAQYAALLAQWEEADQAGNAIPRRAESGSDTEGISPDQLELIIQNTTAVLTEMPEKRAEWREVIAGAKQQAANTNHPVEVEFFQAVLALLDGEVASLAPDHQYGEALEVIQEGVVGGGKRSESEVPVMPGGLPADFVARCRSGLGGGPQEKQVLFTYLNQVGASFHEAGGLSLLKAVQLAIFGQDPATLGGDLPEPYHQIWRAIVNP
jgi:hypothetical protein